MKVTFYLVVLNHHQACVADELYQLLGDEFRFVELLGSTETKGSKVDYSKRPYLIKDWENESQHGQALALLRTSDVCVFGGAESLPLLKRRMYYGSLSFDISERWLKRGGGNLFSPRLLKMLWGYYHFQLQNKPLYKLCASAFAANDFYKLGVFKNRCYQWGYFTNVEKLDIEKVLLEKQLHSSSNNQVTIMWCARLIDWKHPELPVLMTKQLRSKGYLVKVDMYGVGKENEKIQALIDSYELSNYVELKGFCSNDFIQRAMQEHDIFVFTSDKNEGWGAVLNEAMSNGCTVVASDEIGAAPFLINDGINGLIFKSKRIESLIEKVEFLINHPDIRKQMALKAYATMRDVWSPELAAKNFIQLIEDIQNGRESSIQKGPCAQAFPL